MRKDDKSLQDFLDYSPNPILVINPDSSIRYANRAFEYFTGLRSTSVVGIKAPYPWWTEETRAKSISDIRKIIRRGAKNREEVFKNGNRERFWFEINSVTIKKNGKPSYYLSNWVDITKRKIAEDKLKILNEQLRNLSLKLEGTREKERALIAREIHDGLGQALLALKINLYWLNDELGVDHKCLHDVINSMLATIDEAIQKVKWISIELRPRLLDDMGLASTIEWLAKEFQRATGIVCKVHSNLGDLKLSTEVSTTIFRIFQEALANIFRHAHATRVTIRLKQDDGNIVVKVVDNGKGITKENIEDPRSFGLVGMRERANQWGGHVQISGIINRSTTVIVRIPYSNTGGSVRVENTDSR